MATLRGTFLALAQNGPVRMGQYDRRRLWSRVPARTTRPRLVFHICPRRAWEKALAAGLYRGVDADRADGFLHFSAAGQVRESARRHRAGMPEVVLLCVEAARLGAAFEWETSLAGESFPHLYGALPLSAVLRVDALGPDRRHLFPALLTAAR